MKSIVAILVFAVGPFAFGQSNQVWTGFVTDTHCGAHCQRTSAMKPDPACVRLCVRRGSKYGLWHGDHVYVLEPQSVAAKFAAENVRVKGSFSQDAIRIKSIALAPHLKVLRG